MSRPLSSFARSAEGRPSPSRSSRHAAYRSKGRQTRGWPPKRADKPDPESPDEYAPRKSTLASFSELAHQWLANKEGDRQREHLNHMWNNWDMVLGPELAPLALPLGHREGILLLGAEDHFLMQELSYATPEILERVNAFMDAPFFHKVEWHLLADRVPLNQTKATVLPPLPQLVRPERLGGLNLDENSPIGRCYAAYLRVFDPKI